MKRLALLLPLLAACANLDEPRAYRCESSQDCVSPWVCLKDQYCHDPSIGVATACETSTDCAGGWACARDNLCHNPDAGIAVDCEATSDCLGGWFCGKDLRCHNPSVAAALTCDNATQCGAGWFCANDGVCHDPLLPAALPCASDVNCAGGWRCDTEGLCVEPPPALNLPATLRTTTLRSPLAGRASRLQASPSWTENDGGTLVLQAAFVSGGVGYVETMKVTESATAIAVDVRRDALPVSGVTNATMSQDWYLAAVDGGVVLSRVGSSTSTLLPVTPREFRPLLFPQLDGGLQANFLLKVDGGLGFIVPTDAGLSFSFDAGAADLEYTQGEPFYAQLLLDGRVASGLGTRFTDAGTPVRGWVENNHVGITVRRPNGVLWGQFLREDDSNFSRPFSCPEGDVLDLSFSTALRDGPAEYVCRGSTGAYVWQVHPTQAASLHHDYASVISSGVSGGHTRQLSNGVLRLGTDLMSDFPDVLDGRPTAIGTVFNSASLVAVRNQSLFLDNGAGVPMGLGLSLMAAPGASHMVGFVSGTTCAISSAGVVIDFGTQASGDDTYPWIFQGTPTLVAPTAEALTSSAGSVLVAADGDTLWAGLRGDVVRPVLKPTPGFPLASWVVRPSGGETFEGWAVANNRLFSFSATDVERWKLKEIALNGRDPFGVTWLGDDAWVTTTFGELIAIPSRVSMVAPLDEPLTSFEGVCNTVVATTSTEPLQLTASDAGFEWTPLETGRVLRSPRVHRYGARLFLSSDDGFVLELNNVCPP